MKKRDLKELLNLFPGDFKGCHNEVDIACKLNELNKSRDVYYEDEAIVKGEYYDEAEGYFLVELGRNKEPIKCYVDVYLEGYDSEERAYSNESFGSTNGWSYYHIVTNLKIRRQARALSQSKLAELSGVNLRILQYYEQGTKDINKAAAITVYNLARALKCKVEDLLELD